MPRQLIRLLTLIALLFASIGMMSAHASAAAPANGPDTAMAGHCAEMSGSGQETPKDRPTNKSIDCLIACACVPARNADSLDPQPIFVSALPIVLLSLVPDGLNPAADPPPPRFS